MTDDGSELYDKLGRVGDTLTVFRDEAIRLNDEIYDLEPGSREHHQKKLELDVAVADWRQSRQEFQEIQRTIERQDYTREGLVPGRSLHEGLNRRDTLAVDRELDDVDWEQDRVLGRERERER